MEFACMRDVCCIVQFLGFDVSRRGYKLGNWPDEYFVLKELAFVQVSRTEFYSPTSFFFDLHNFNFSPTEDLNIIQNIENQTKNLHGLLFWSPEEEVNAMEIRKYNYRLQLLLDIQNWTIRGPNKKQNVVAYYDGCMREDGYLKSRFIPTVCLKDHGVPSYDELCKEKSYSHITCGFHTHGTNPSLPCPRAAVAAYRDWWMSRYQE